MNITTIGQLSILTLFTHYGGTHHQKHYRRFILLHQSTDLQSGVGPTALCGRNPLLLRDWWNAKEWVSLHCAENEYMRGKNGLFSVKLVSVNKLKLLAVVKNKLLSGKQNLWFSHRTVTSRLSHTATAQTLIHCQCDRCCFNFHIFNLQSSSETSPWMLRVKVHSSSDLACLIRLYMTHTNIHSLISIVLEKWHTQDSNVIRNAWNQSRGWDILPFHTWTHAFSIIQPMSTWGQCGTTITVIKYMANL